MVLIFKPSDLGKASKTGCSVKVSAPTRRVRQLERSILRALVDVCKLTAVTVTLWRRSLVLPRRYGGIGIHGNRAAAAKTGRATVLHPRMRSSTHGVPVAASRASMAMPLRYQNCTSCSQR